MRAVIADITMFQGKRPPKCLQTNVSRKNSRADDAYYGTVWALSL